MSQNQTQATASGPAARPRQSARRRIAQSRGRLGRLVFRLLLAAIVIVLAANLFTKNKTYSEAENRSLAQFPSFSLSALKDGSYFSDLTDSFSDQFAGRNRWISLHLQELKLMGQHESGGVYLGKDGYLLLAPEDPDREAIAGSVAAINQLAADYPDLHTTMIIVPGASTTMRDYGPKNMPARDQNADIADFESQLSSSITCVDAGAVLAEHTDEYIYYKTDHHWTSLGAYYTFQAAVDALDISAYVSDFDVYPVTDSFQGTLASKSGSHKVSDTINIYLPRTEVRYTVTRGEETTKNCSIFNSEALSSSDQYTVFFGGNYSKVDIQTTVSNGRKLLVFKDSYANSFMQFLLPCYERIIMIDPRYYYGSMDELLNLGITDVLYLYTADNALTSTTLKDVVTSYSGGDAATDTTAADSGSATADSSDTESSAGDTDADSYTDSGAETQADPADSSAE